jgi:hypothetical protein
VSRGTLLARLLPSADPRWTEALRGARPSRRLPRCRRRGAPARREGDLPGVERDLSNGRRCLPPAGPRSSVHRRRDAGVGHKPKVVEGLAATLVKKGRAPAPARRWIIAREPVEDVIARLRATGKTSFDVGEFKEMFA